MADGSPLRRTITLDTVPLPDTSRITGGAGARLGDAAMGFADTVYREGQRQSREAVALEAAAEKARTEAGLVNARLSGAKELNDLYAGFATDPDPATAPQRFDESARKIRDRIGASITNPDAANSFALQFGTLAETHRIALRHEGLQRETQAAVASLDSQLSDAAQGAATASSEAQRDAILDMAEGSVHGLVGAGMLSAEAGVNRVQKFKGNLAMLDARRAIFADPSRAKTALEKGEFAALEPLERQSLIEHAQAELEQRARARDVAKLQAREDARDALDQVKTVTEAGYVPAPDLLQAAAAKVRAAGEPSLQRQLQSHFKAAATVEALRGATPRDVEAALSSIDAKAKNGAGPDEAAAAIALRKFAGTMHVALGKDPLSWAAQQGVVDVQPLKLDGSDNGDAWKARQRAADLVAARYGVAPSYLTDAETDALMARFSSSNVDEKMNTLAMLAGGLGEKRGSVLQKLAPNNPVAAHVGGLIGPGSTTEQRSAARDALIGETLAREKGGEDLKPTAAARAGRDATGIRQALSFLPDDAARVFATGDAIYAARAPARGLRGAGVGAGDDAATALYFEALNASLGATRGSDGRVYGGMARYNGAPVIAPASVPADDFEALVHGLSDTTLAAASASGAAPMLGDKPFTAKDLRRSYLLSIGDGLYAVSTTDPADGAPSIVHDAKGAPYKLVLSNVDRSRAIRALPP